MKNERPLPSGDETLHDAREWFKAGLKDGTSCPCCGRFGKIYLRSISSTMAHALVLIAHWTKEATRCIECSSPVMLLPGGETVCSNHRCGKKGSLEWRHMPSFLAAQKLSPKALAALRGDWPKLCYWGLLEARPMLRDDGSPRNGQYRITSKGMTFAHNKLAVPKYMLVFNRRPAPWPGDETITIADAFKTPFDYDKLMSGVQ